MWYVLSRNVFFWEYFFCQIDDCHEKQANGDYLNRKDWRMLKQCSGPKSCPLGIRHPPNGKEEFCLGCNICRHREVV